MCVIAGYGSIRTEKSDEKGENKTTKSEYHLAHGKIKKLSSVLCNATVKGLYICAIIREPKGTYISKVPATLHS